MKTFLSTHPLHEQSRFGVAADANADIPDDLRTMLRDVSANTYASGFFRFISAETVRDYFSLWSLVPAECFGFLKCGFGQLVFYHRGHYKLLNPVFNSIEVLGDTKGLTFVMDIALCDRPALESSFLIDVYEKAFPKLGAPGPEELFAFVPPLGLGGARDATHVRRSKMGVEMAMLSQL